MKPERNIALKLTMEEACDLLSLLYEVPSYLSQSNTAVRKRLAIAKAKAVRRGCGRAPARK